MNSLQFSLFDNQGNEQASRSEIAWLNIESLSPHPDNPRLIYREDIIETIAQSIAEKGFQPEYALLVRPLGNGYQIISGHTRHKAALKAGLAKLPCWVKDLDDETAFMELVLANNQGELSPLEYGMHVLKYVELSEGGRGKKGGLSEYARVVGKGKSRLSEYQSAAKVVHALNCSDVGTVLDKANHLAAIHKAPSQYWQKLTEMLIEKKWSVKETEAIVSKVKAIADLECPPWLSGILKLDEAWVKAIEDERLSGTLTSCARAAMEAYESFGIEVVEIVENGEIRNEEWDLQARYVELLVSTPGISQNLTPGKFDPPRKVLNRQVEELRRQAEKFKLGQAEGVERKRLEEEERLRKQQLAAEYKPVGHCGAFGEVLFQLTPNSFDLVLTDPPYLLSNDGITARGNKQVSVNKNFSDRFGEASPPESWLPDCLKLLKPGGVLAFTCTEHLNMTAARLEAQGFEYLERLFWIKRSAPPRLTPTGHRACVEEIWVARKPGETHFFNYELLKENYWKGKQASNYLEFEQCSGNERLGWHDTQKPLSLWKYLLEAYCPEDGTVLDPFSGSGTTAVAAKQLRRKAIWVELSNEFFNLANDRLEKSPYFWEVE
jgi:site-specific DNA-methyltransferase (adenine-specific)